ncbi:hypothetical protein BpHYR1_007991 [Brachionus plicatilis]|uniref:Uncharacterized protein n=1 Tax=Brachionus plicatilis TaxID=10195 RepID=A0A3M7R3S2_BRAPC|nr:hypothetical protein BpHYR1_007991 [Brachionus plicatilis]
MKSVLLIVLLGFAYATAQDIGTDFLIDNIVSPTVNDIISGVGNYLVTSLANWVTGLFGKRDLNVNQIISQVQNLVSNYQTQIDQIIAGFSTQIQNLFNILNLATPAKSALRIEYVHRIADVELKIREETVNFLSDLYAIFQQIFGQHFENLFNSHGRSVFNNVTSIINNLTNTITQVLENYGESFLQTAVNISDLSQPLLQQLQQQLGVDADQLVQHFQQIINQFQQN